VKLIDLRTADGSRLFSRLPKVVAWPLLRDHLAALPGSHAISSVIESNDQPRLEFSYAGHRFVIRNAGGHFCFYVSDPLCNDLKLFRVVAHCENLLAGSRG
jgi:hypothetical protein